MKLLKFILPFCFITISAILCAQEYPIPENKSTYGYLTYYLPYGELTKIEGSIEGPIILTDTLINDTLYKNLGSYMYFRTEDKRTYVLDPWYSDTEMLLFDFNLDVGDTFKLAYTNEEVQVTLKALIDLGVGGPRLQIIFNNGAYSWFEGIGDLTYGYNYYYGSSSKSRQLVCYSDSLGVVDKDPNLDIPCDELDTYYKEFTAITDFESSSIAVSMVKTNVLRISSEQVNIQVVEVFDVLGNSVLKHFTNSSLFETSLGNVTPGVYIVRVNNLLCKKVIVE